ncbi:CNP1-like family protein [Rhodoferax saidenbachensis]|uniref:CNP1-like uncharacterized domain-containing protein n=1 Tax=Rhodoferax saidenbachensis TaxID=1484693 RepID=A0ABU1ZJ81_9BURK|nr:CNP1-like family protein [Rhodoferax saidenbachensis]MDR7305602.1 hypothetical protein [Rhodoferax saidenbachensis]
MTKGFITKKGVALALYWFASVVSAQNTLDNPDWVEEKEPPPPAYSTTKVLALEMPHYVSVKVSIDPSTILVGNDGIVRYVAVMTNRTGTTNAVYEGIRCVSDEVKTYARAGSSGEWSLVSEPAWKPVNDNLPSKHAYAFARQAACQSRVASSKSEIIKALQTGIKPGQSNQVFYN